MTMAFTFKGQTYQIDKWLAARLDTIVYNITEDHDVVIVITGDRTVRVGKSVLAMTVAAYLSSRLKAFLKEDFKKEFDIDDIYFDNKVMIDKAQSKPKYAINLYDEGREGLAASKALRSFQQDLIDFFNECGQLNQVFIVVAPDFFTLKEDIAVARSEYLINVFRKDKDKIIKDMYGDGVDVKVIKWERGYFEFYTRKRKQILYDKFQSTHKKLYNLVKYNFWGNFKKQYPLDEDTYRNRKRDALTRFKEKKLSDKEPRARHADKLRDYIILEMREKKFTYKKISEELKRLYDYDFGVEGVRKVIKKNEITADVQDFVRSKSLNVIPNPQDENKKSEIYE